MAGGDEGNGFIIAIGIVSGYFEVYDVDDSPTGWVVRTSVRVTKEGTIKFVDFSEETLEQKCRVAD